MKANFDFVKRSIDELEEDGDKSLFFYNNPRSRAKLIQDMLAFSVAHIDHIHEPLDNSKRVHEIIRWLDNNYQGFEWPLHEVHFHPNFFTFCTCTFTCLNEISDVLEKIMRERFAA